MTADGWTVTHVGAIASEQQVDAWLADLPRSDTTPADATANPGDEPAGPIVLSNVEVVETTRYCIAFEADLDNSALVEQAGLTDEFRLGLVLLTQPTNPTGWAFATAATGTRC